MDGRSISKNVECGPQTVVLIDECTLIIHPLVLGTGQRLFAEGVPTTSLGRKRLF